jgi:hypothetical protein
VPNHPGDDSVMARTGEQLIGREPRSVGPGTHDINGTVMPPDPQGPVVLSYVVGVCLARTLLCAVRFPMVR